MTEPTLKIDGPMSIEQTVEIVQAITEEQHYRIAELATRNRFDFGRWKGSTHYVIGPLSALAAANVWEYLCDERIRAELVTETRLRNFAEAAA
jgi:hypothetical protein